MKIFAILLMAISAMVLIDALPTNNQQTPLLEGIRQWPSWNNAKDSNESNENKRGHNSWRKTQSGPFDSSSSNENDSSDRQNRQHQQKSQHRHNQLVGDVDDVATDLIDVQPFHTKIMRRIEESERLSNQSDIKRKITKLAEDKLDACKHQSAGSKGKANRHCLGRATGQMMQIIAGFENGSRDLPGSYDF